MNRSSTAGSPFTDSTITNAATSQLASIDLPLAGSATLQPASAGSSLAQSRLVALTTRDGKVVQEHFGHARHFHIVRIEVDGTWAYVESRTCEPGCADGIMHDDLHDARFAPIVELLADCDIVITAQIGSGAAAYVLTHGLRVFQARGFVSDILDEIAKVLINENATATNAAGAAGSVGNDKDAGINDD